MLEVAPLMHVTRSFKEKFTLLFLQDLPRILARLLLRFYQARGFTWVFSRGPDLLGIPLDGLNGLIESPELRFEELKTINLSLLLQIECLNLF